MCCLVRANGAITAWTRSAGEEESHSADSELTRSCVIERRWLRRSSPLSATTLFLSAARIFSTPPGKAETHSCRQFLLSLVSRSAMSTISFFNSTSVVGDTPLGGRKVNDGGALRG